jgi:hypothetical protein
MFLAAMVSAGPASPHDTQLNLACEARLALQV